MTSVLILLTLPPDVNAQYYDSIRTAFPALRVNMVDHVSKADPYLAQTDVLITFGPHLEGQADRLLQRAPRLKWIQALGTGVDNIVDRPTLRDDVILTNIHGIHGPAMSEAALMAMLALSRNLPKLVRQQDNRVWERRPGRLLEGKTVGIFGIGAIAEALAPRCKALGMKVVGISSARREVAGFDHMYDRDELPVAVRQLDYFVLLTPYSPATHHIVDARVLAAMKLTSYLVNLARGGVVDEDALIDVLRQRRIAGAALDVFAKEPLAKESPFWTMDNVLITPHVGGFNDGYARQALVVVNENIRRFLAGDTAHMINVVKRESKSA
jgi:D-2-hydroxyacid dehydrogenase (NADP+)